MNIANLIISNKKKILYYLLISFFSFYWIIMAPPRYLSQAEVFVQERHDTRQTPTSGEASDERYIMSSDGRAIAKAWLISEAPFRLIDAGAERPGLYAPESWLVRLLQPGSWERRGDWRRWQHFRNAIKVTEHSDSLEIAFESYDPVTSYDVINDILNGARTFISALSTTEDSLYRDRAHYNAEYYRRQLSSYSESEGEGLQALEHTVLPELYQRREHLLDKLRDATLANAIREKNYGLGSVNSGNLHLEIDWLRREIEQANSEMARQQGRLSHETIRDAYLRSTLQELVMYDRPEFDLNSRLYTPLYKIILISKPSRFGQQYGPFRLRALLISLCIISVLYWIVKD